MKKAFVTGITGQDGSYLAELLLEKGYEVHGLVRRTSSFNRGRIEHIYKGKKRNSELFLHYGDLTDSSNLGSLLKDIQPNEIYNLGAQSHVKVSFEVPEYSADVDGLGTLRLLQAMYEFCPESRFYQASTSELFGKVLETPQSETTPFNPVSPYAIAKQYAFWITRNYRDTYHLHASNGILFNHESPRRGESFVTRKITMAAARFHMGCDEECLALGNLEARRDWGYAKEYVAVMWSMLQQDRPDDYVVATGETHSVREFVEKAFSYLGHDVIWKGAARDEYGIDRATGKQIVRIDPAYYRPAEVDILKGDASKAKRQLGWEAKTHFEELVKIMVDGDLRLLTRPGYEIGF